MTVGHEKTAHEHDSTGEMLLAEKPYSTMIAQTLYSGPKKERLLGNIEAACRQIHSLSYNLKARRARQALCQ